MCRTTTYARSPKVKSERTTQQKLRQHYERVFVVEIEKIYIYYFSRKRVTDSSQLSVTLQRATMGDDLIFRRNVQNIYFLLASLKWRHSLRGMRARNCLFWVNPECVCTDFFITPCKKLLLPVLSPVPLCSYSKHRRKSLTFLPCIIIYF